MEVNYGPDRTLDGSLVENQLHSKITGKTQDFAYSSQRKKSEILELDAEDKGAIGGWVRAQGTSEELP